MYGIILSSKLIIPNWTDLVNGDEVEEDLAEEEEELPESPTWAPNTWKRAHWLWGRGVLFGCLRVVGGTRISTAMLRGGSGRHDDVSS